MRTDGRRDGQTDMIKLIVDFLNFANALKKLEFSLSTPNIYIYIYIYIYTHTHTHTHARERGRGAA